MQVSGVRTETMPLELLDPETKQILKD